MGMVIKEIWYSNEDGKKTRARVGSPVGHTRTAELNEVQVNEIIFGDGGYVLALSDNTVIIVPHHRVLLTGAHIPQVETVQ